MDEEYDVTSPAFFAEFAKAWAKTVEDDRRLGLIVQRRGDAATSQRHQENDSWH